MLVDSATRYRREPLFCPLAHASHRRWWRCPTPSIEVIRRRKARSLISRSVPPHSSDPPYGARPLGRPGSISCAYRAPRRKEGGLGPCGSRSLAQELMCSSPGALGKGARFATAITAPFPGAAVNRSPRCTRPVCRLRRRYAHSARVPFPVGDARPRPPAVLNHLERTCDCNGLEEFDALRYRSSSHAAYFVEFYLRCLLFVS